MPKCDTKRVVVFGSLEVGVGRFVAKLRVTEEGHVLHVFLRTEIAHYLSKMRQYKKHGCDGCERVRKEIIDHIQPTDIACRQYP